MSVEQHRVNQIVSETYGFDLEYKIETLINASLLPPDLLLRLSIIGAQTIDPESGELLRPKILKDFLSFATDGTPLSETAADILYLAPAQVLLNFKGYDRSELNAITADYEGPYYARDDLVDAVKFRRLSEDKTIQNPWQDRTRNYNRHWSEDSVAKGLAHAVWRALLARAKPEWITDKGLQKFWVPRVTTTQKGTRLKIELDAEYALMRRELVYAALFTDEILLELLEEADLRRIKGLGKIGIYDLKIMLSEQHPELHPEK